jgi:hypothetical protein
MSLGFSSFFRKKKHVILGVIYRPYGNINAYVVLKILVKILVLKIKNRKNLNSIY